MFLLGLKQNSKVFVGSFRLNNFQTKDLSTDHSETVIFVASKMVCTSYFERTPRCIHMFALHCCLSSLFNVVKYPVVLKCLLRFAVRAS